MWHELAFWRLATITTAAVGQTLFVILYATFPWWRTFMGRALFLKAVAFALLVDIAIVGSLIDWKGEDVTFVTLYGALAVGIWGQLLAFAHVRFNGRQAEVSGNPRPEQGSER